MTALFLLCAPALAQEARSQAAVFQEANGAYRGGDYARAAELYESLVSENWRNGNIFYNLGNVYFKQKQLGRAILNYERARQYRPRDRDLAANLAYVRKLLEYRVEDKRNWYLRTADMLLNLFTQMEIGLITLFWGILFWTSWAFSLHFHSGPVWGWRRKTLLLIAATCLTLWISKSLYDVTVQEAVTLKPKTLLRYGPSPKDQVAFRLGEGIKVRVTKKAEDWRQAVLPNGEAGWVSLEDIGVI